MYYNINAKPENITRSPECNLVQPQKTFPHFIFSKLR